MFFVKYILVFFKFIYLRRERSDIYVLRRRVVYNLDDFSLKKVILGANC